MIFHNTTQSQVFLTIDSHEFTLLPDESVEVNCQETAYIDLRHIYKSTALSEKEIRADDNDISLISLALSSYQPPYFNIVLHSQYRISCGIDSVIQIQQQKIRPTYTCAYDRLYPCISHGFVEDLSQDFPEKELFKQHYRRAKKSGAKQILTILSIIASILSLPLIALLTAARPLIGIVSLLLFLIGLIAIWAIGLCVNALVAKADYAFVFKNFESDTIIQFFSDAENKAQTEKNN